MNDVPIGALIVLFVGGGALLGTAAFLIVRRFEFRSPNTGADTLISAFSARATTLFAVLLVFTIVSEFNHVDDAEGTAQREATALAQIVRDAGPFPGAVRASIRTAVGAYATTVVHREWPSLGRSGQPSSTAATQLNAIERTIQSYQPRGATAAAFYTQEVDQLEVLVGARRDRLQAAIHEIPNELLWLIFAGGIVFIATMLTFSAAKDSLLMAHIGLLAALTGGGLLIVVMFNYPFSGSVAISNAAFHQGVLQGLVPA